MIADVRRPVRPKASPGRPLSGCGRDCAEAETIEKQTRTLRHEIEILEKSVRFELVS